MLFKSGQRAQKRWHRSGGLDQLSAEAIVLQYCQGLNATGVFWGAFTLFAATTASILSGAVIERIKLVAFVVLAIVLGAFA